MSTPPTIPAETSKPETLAVLTADDVMRIERIKSYDASAKKAFQDQMGYVFLAGMELNAAKADLPHGSFTDWREAYIPQIPERSAQRYMQFAEVLSKSATVAVLPIMGNPKLLESGKLAEEEKQAILQAVHDATDGKTLTQLYRDMGIIRPPERPKHHPHKNDPAVQINKAGEQPATDLADDALTDALMLVNPEDPLLPEKDTEFLQKLHAAWKAGQSRIEQILKKRRVKL